MPLNELYKLQRSDVPRAAACLKDAFQSDPLWHLVFKDDPNKDQALDAFFTVPLLYGLKFGKVYATSEALEGLAVWVPDKYANMTLFGLLRSGAMSYATKMNRSTMQNLSIVSNHLGPARKRLMKGLAYDYVTIVGVSSAYQGLGHGKKLMAAIQDDCHSRDRAIYLETETIENVAFYEKLGFHLLDTIEFKKLNHPMWLMGLGTGV